MKWYQKYTGAIVEVISWLFIILFAYAGFTKFLEGHLFHDNILNSPLLGDKVIASLVSWTIPLSEIVVALLLVWKRTSLLGFYAALSLMLLFTGYTVAILFFSPYIPCSCGGIISLLSWEEHLVFNLLFLLLAILAILLSRKQNYMQWYKIHSGL